MATKLRSSLFTWLILTTVLFTIFYTKLLPFFPNPKTPSLPPIPCNLFTGKWVFDPTRKKPMYDETCPFQRNSWNCIRNQRDNMDLINSWKWVPEKCELFEIDPVEFMGVMRDKSIGFVGDSLNENFVVSLLCILRESDLGANKWKRKGAWRGAYFPKFNITVGYHRAVLLAKYECQPKQSDITEGDEMKGVHRVDVDIPAKDWADFMMFSFSIRDTGGVMISSQKSRLLLSTKGGNQ